MEATITGDRSYNPHPCSSAFISAKSNHPNQSMKKLLNALPLFIALLLIGYSCTKSDPEFLFQFPSNVSASSQIWQVKEGSIYDGDTLRYIYSTK